MDGGGLAITLFMQHAYNKSKIGNKAAAVCKMNYIYCCCTACMCHRFSTRSRLWRVDFDDLTNPLAGGTLTAVVEGSEKPQAGTPKMMDNLVSTCDGSVYLQVSSLCVMLCKQCAS